MKNKTTYGPAAKRHAITLLSQGWTAEQIREVEVCADIPAETLRSWKYRMQQQTSKTETVKQKNETPETESETVATPATAQNSAEKPAFVRFIGDFTRNFHPIDILFYASISIGFQGVASALHPVGVYVAAILVGVAVIALHGLKTLRGLQRIWHAVAMLFAEASFFASDVVWSNKALWSNISALPFDIWVNKYRNDAGELVLLYGGSDTDKPFYLACAVAFVLFFSALYACIIALQKE